MAKVTLKKRTAKKSEGSRSAGSSASRRSTVKGGDYDPSEDEITEQIPTGLSRAFVESKLHEKRLRQSGLSAPQDWEGEMPELPEDVAATDYNELSQLLVDFQSALSTATWKASMAYIDADIMEEIADYLEMRALLSADESNDTKRRAAARTEERVVFFRGRQKIAYHDYVRFRDLAKTIEGKVKVISRVGGFKDDDDNAGDRKVGRAGAAHGSGKRSARVNLRRG